jgi:hypothetical protein
MTVGCIADLRLVTTHSGVITVYNFFINGNKENNKEDFRNYWFLFVCTYSL